MIKNTIELNLWKNIYNQWLILKKETRVLMVSYTDGILCTCKKQFSPNTHFDGNEFMHDNKMDS